MRLGADVIVFSRAVCSGYSLLSIGGYMCIEMHMTYCKLFSIRKATQSVGLLSYTYLRQTGQDDVIVPMVSTFITTIMEVLPLLQVGFCLKNDNYVPFELQVDFDVSGNDAKPIVYGTQHSWNSNLQTILEWSPFQSKDELMLQVN